MISKVSSSLTSQEAGQAASTIAQNDSNNATYECDIWCNMTKATVGANSSVYRYNGDGLCVRKDVSSAEFTDIILYLYQGGKAILETDSAGVQKSSNLHGNNDLISKTTSGIVTYFKYNGRCDVTTLTGADGTT